MLIFLEGIDGSGKSSVAEELKSNYFKEAKMLKLPTDRLRESIHKKKSVVSAAYSFMSDIADVLSLEVMPALAEGKDVIVDRSWLSTIVYQGEGLRKFVADNGALQDFEDSINNGAYLAFCEGVANLPKSAQYPEAFIVVLVPETKEALNRVLDRNKERGASADKYEDVSFSVWDYRNQEYKRLAEEDTTSIPKILIDTRGLSVKDTAAKVYDNLMDYSQFEDPFETIGIDDLMIPETHHIIKLQLW